MLHSVLELEAGEKNFPTLIALSSMAIRVVEFFQMGGIKLERFLPKNQHTQRKLLNFENWISGGLRSFQKSEF